MASLFAGGVVDVPLHVERVCNLAERTLQLWQLAVQMVQVELDPHEEHSTLGVHGVLIGLDDIGAVLEQKARDGRYDPRSIRTRDQHAGTIRV